MSYFFPDSPSFDYTNSYIKTVQTNFPWDYYLLHYSLVYTYFLFCCIKSYLINLLLIYWYCVIIFDFDLILYHVRFLPAVIYCFIWLFGTVVYFVTTWFSHIRTFRFFETNLSFCRENRSLIVLFWNLCYDFDSIPFVRLVVLLSMFSCFHSSNRLWK